MSSEMTPYKGPLGSLERPEQGAASLRAMLVRKLASPDVDDDIADINQYYGDIGHDSINAAVSHQRAERIADMIEEDDSKRMQNPNGPGIAKGPWMTKRVHLCKCGDILQEIEKIDDAALVFGFADPHSYIVVERTRELACHCENPGPEDSHEGFTHTECEYRFYGCRCAKHVLRALMNVERVPLSSETQPIVEKWSFLTRPLECAQLNWGMRQLICRSAVGQPAREPGVAKLHLMLHAESLIKQITAAVGFVWRTPERTFQDMLQEAVLRLDLHKYLDAEDAAYVSTRWKPERTKQIKLRRQQDAITMICKDHGLLGPGIIKHGRVYKIVMGGVGWKHEPQQEIRTLPYKFIEG